MISLPTPDRNQTEFLHDDKGCRGTVDTINDGYYYRFSYRLLTYRRHRRGGLYSSQSRHPLGRTLQRTSSGARGGLSAGQRFGELQKHGH